MAVQRSSVDTIPADAILLTEENVLQYHWKLIRSWTPKTDVWALQQGFSILGGASALTSIYMHNYFRRTLKLGDIGRLSSYLPVTILPAVMSALFHQQFVTKDILLQKTPCPVCLQLRAAGIQTFFGTVYPVILAPLTGFMLAIRYYTYDVPSITADTRGVFGLWRKLVLKKGNVFLGFAIAQAVVSSAITYYEAKSFYDIQSKLLASEQLDKDNLQS